ncbi:MAG: hypothetical protein WAX69_25090 [Victivallales bacterium]
MQTKKQTEISFFFKVANFARSLAKKPATCSLGSRWELATKGSVTGA